MELGQITTSEDLLKFFEELAEEDFDLNYPLWSARSNGPVPASLRLSWLYESISTFVHLLSSNRPEWTELRIVAELRSELVKQGRFTESLKALEQYTADHEPQLEGFVPVQWLKNTIDFYRLVDYMISRGLIPEKSGQRLTRFFLDKKGDPMPVHRGPYTSKAKTMTPEPGLRKLINDIAKNSSEG